MGQNPPIARSLGQEIAPLKAHQGPVLVHPQRVAQAAAARWIRLGKAQIIAARPMTR